MPAAVAVPAIIGAAGVGASVFGAVKSSNAARDAAATQAQSAENALQFQKQVYGDQQRNASPYLDMGKNAVTGLWEAMPELTAGFDPAAAGLPAKFSYGPNDFQVDPGYQFALEQGQKAIERSAAARGGLVSGGTAKAIADYSTGMASQQYGNAYQRALQTYQQNYSDAFNTFETSQQNRFNRIRDLVGVGLTANNQAANAGQNYANNAGQYAIGAGNALAAGQVGAANAWNQGMGNALNFAQNAFYASQYRPQNQSGYNPSLPANAFLPQTNPYGGIGAPLSADEFGG